MASLCARAGLPSSLKDRALEMQRMLAAKNSAMGVSSMTQAVLCLHLAATQAGHSVDTKAMVKLAGMKTKPLYTSAFNTAESVLGLEQAVSVQEVAVQLGASHLVTQAANILTAYEAGLRTSLGEARFAHVSLTKPIYACAAVGSACRVAGEKADMGRLAELSRAKKKELADLVEEMMVTAPDKKMKGSKGRKNLNLMETIMGMEEDEEETKENKDTKKGIRERIKEDDLEDDGFDEWRQAILHRAVSDGLTKYKKYLTVKN